jgi:hypothetical protein
MKNKQIIERSVAALAGGLILVFLPSLDYSLGFQAYALAGLIGTLGAASLLVSILPWE